MTVMMALLLHNINVDNDKNCNIDNNNINDNTRKSNDADGTWEINEIH